MQARRGKTRVVLSVCAVLTVLATGGAIGCGTQASVMDPQALKSLADLDGLGDLFLRTGTAQNDVRAE